MEREELDGMREREEWRVCERRGREKSGRESRGSVGAERGIGKWHGGGREGKSDR